MYAVHPVLVRTVTVLQS
uniref:Uncharacterized protein n=1 Tax=Oryza glumipatula TaxID=40148 RepID=A0A0E0BS09_9ORYZ